MPKIYKYFGIVFLFYSREHDPVHVHGRKAGRELKAEFIIEDGIILDIKVKKVSGKLPLENNDKKHFIQFVQAKAPDIKQKWIDFFVDRKNIEMEQIDNLD